MAARIGLQNSATKQTFFSLFFFVLIHKRLRQSLFYLIDQRHKVVKSEIIELETRIYDLSACIQDNRNTHGFSVFFFHPFALQSFTFSISLLPLSLSFYRSPPTLSLFLLYLSGDMCTFFVFYFDYFVSFFILFREKIYKLHKK